MNLTQFHRMRTAIQGNARPGRGHDVEVVEGRLRGVLTDSTLFEEIEVEHTDDPDQLVIALCTFRPDYTADDIAFRLENLWSDRLRGTSWEAHALLTEEDHVELEAASRVGPAGHYVTVHVVAQKATIPHQRSPSS
jgi:hypothetical protein